MTALIALQA